LLQLETSRLTLRDLQEEDVTLIRRMASEHAIKRYQSVLRLESEKAIEEFIRTAISHNNQNPRHAFNLIIVDSREKQSMGWIGWGPSKNPSSAEYGVGYALLPQFWGEGYMTEALHAGLAFMFETLGAQRVTDYCEATNVGSARVMEKQGMKPIARWSGVANDGSSLRYVRYAIQRSQWLLLNPAEFKGLS